MIFKATVDHMLLH